MNENCRGQGALSVLEAPTYYLLHFYFRRSSFFHDSYCLHRLIQVRPRQLMSLLLSIDLSTLFRSCAYRSSLAFPILADASKVHTFSSIIPFLPRDFCNLTRVCCEHLSRGYFQSFAMRELRRKCKPTVEYEEENSVAWSSSAECMHSKCIGPIYTYIRICMYTMHCGCQNVWFITTKNDALAVLSIIIIRNVTNLLSVQFPL